MDTGPREVRSGANVRAGTFRVATPAVTSAMANDSGTGSPQQPVPAVAAPGHTLAVADVCAQLGVDPAAGLSPDEAADRAQRHGPNAIREKPARAPWRMLLDQFADFMILVLIAAAIISGIIGDLKDTLAIVVIVLLNAVIGFVQEFRAERAMVALRKMTAAHAHVVRGGEVCVVPVAEVVPGDVALLEAGNIVPADVRLVEAVALRVDESLLTGESVPTEKHCAPLPPHDLPVGDRRNLAYKGTILAHGRGRGIVIATGMATELGRIATLLDEAIAPRTPLQQRLAVFGRRLGLAVIAICVIVFAVGLLRGEPPLLLFLTAISLAVAAIPEALPAVVTISLALGAGKMARQHALIRRLPAVETLGSVTWICSDKTGTLTLNRMRVVEAWAAPGATRDWKAAVAAEPWRTLFTALALSNDAARDRHGRMTGDPTEVALYHAALDAGFDKAVLERDAPRLLEVPFDSERKRMTTVHRAEAGAIAYTKGAPESVLPSCTTMLTGDGERPLPFAAARDAAERMAAEGLRVLAIARRPLPAPPAVTDGAAIESDLGFVGLVGLIDPPRQEAKKAVAVCGTAGIAPAMITGDHPATALAIARELGIAADGTQMITGPELARLSDEALARRVAAVRVYARVDPAQKIRIVEALQRRGEIVAMTGDGVNDAPALKRADIGIAMGKGGTDVAREAASLVLLDDNFATIVEAVREGRRIFDNIRKFIRFVMTGNSGEIWTIFLAPFLGLPMPLLPIQILWINLVTDGLPGLALAAEAAEPGVMRRPPRHPRESVFAHGLWQHVVWVGLLIGGLSLFAQAWAIHTGSTHWQTIVFTVLTLSQLAHVMAIRSERESLFRQGVTTNPPLLAAVAFTIGLQIAAIYVPFLNGVLDTAPLTAGELAFCFILAGVTFVAVEVEKFLVRRGRLYAERPRSRVTRSA
jgi:P-type Ca2+ transporter type 2C